MRHWRVVIVFLLLVLTACNNALDPNLKTARAFLDSYYVMANQQAALPLTSGHATETINQEIALLAGVEARDDSYKSRDMNFKLIESQTVGSDANYFYELTITQPGLGKMTKHVSIIVDPTTQKVKDFRTVD